MPFMIEKEPKFWSPITACMPIDDGHREDTFRARFKLMDSDKYAEMLAGTVEVTDFLSEAIVDLSEITDEKGNAIPYSDDLKMAVVKNSIMRAGLLNGYITAVSKAKSGN